MATKTKKEEAAPVLSLDEFCRRMSERERRFTRVSGFHAHAQQKALVRATNDDFTKAYEAFLKAKA